MPTIPAASPDAPYDAPYDARYDAPYDALHDATHDTPGEDEPRPAAADWSVVVPVKGGDRAKSRLRAPDGVDRLALATALALDTVAAVVAASGERWPVVDQGLADVGVVEVVVVTSDNHLARAVTALGARVVDDPGEGLDAAVGRGAQEARSPYVAVLLGDLPSLRPGDLRVALRAAAAHPRAVVPDADGIGTVLLTARAPATVKPHFGGASAAAHVASGCVRLDLDLPRLRRDVDDESALDAALVLGVGEHTTALLAHLAESATRTA